MKQDEYEKNLTSSLKARPTNGWSDPTLLLSSTFSLALQIKTIQLYVGKNQNVSGYPEYS